MKRKKINESASSGATSAGGIASVASGVNFPLHRRIPPTNIFGGYSPVPDDNTKGKKKKNGK